MEMEKSMECNWERVRTSDETLSSHQSDSMRPSSSTMGGSDQELVTEFSQALEEMTTTWDESIYVGAGVHPTSVPHHFKINPSDIKEIRPIGKGGSAKVYEATWLGCTCAVKRFSASYSVEFISLVERELGFLTTLNHPHIVRLFGLSVDSQQRCSIVMEFMNNSLRALIEERLREKKENDNLASLVPFTPSEALDIITRMALGMWFLHSKGVSHRDLKSANVLIQDLCGSFEVKIVDFGVSLNIDSSGIMGVSVVGTGFWMAPEILRLKTDKSCKPDLKAADVYSFAMTCYEVLTGKIPFQDLLKPGPKETEKVIGGLRPELPTNLDGHLRGLIKACWDSDPTLRPNFERICKELVSIRSNKRGVRITLSIGKDMILSPFRWISHVYGACSRLLDRVLGNEQSTRFSDSDSNLPWSDDEESSSEEDWDGVNASQKIIKAAIPKLKNQFKLLTFIKPGNLKKVRCIWQGATFRIYKATWLGCTFAVKRFPWNLRESRFVDLEDRVRELELLMTLCHPYIIQVVGLSISSNGAFNIVMEIMDGSLRDLINRRMWMERYDSSNVVSLDKYEKRFLEYGYVPFALDEVVFIIRRIALAMSFLHSRDVVHRDLTPGNVVIQELHSGYFDLRLVGFDVSKYFYESETHENEIGKNTFWHSRVGTGFFRAPEMLNGSISTLIVDRSRRPDLKAVDVYSFAMTCYEVITGDLPMSHLDRGNYGKVIKGYRPTLPSDICYTNLKVLIEQCWHGQPQQRPDFTYICEELQRIEQALASSIS